MATENTPYMLGQKVSIISSPTLSRYEGILYTFDERDETITLAKVKLWGTEGRSQKSVPPVDEPYEYIIFRASDIKDLIFPDMPQSSTSNTGLLTDPAIVCHSAKVLHSAAGQAYGQNQLSYLGNMQPASHFQQRIPFHQLPATMYPRTGGVNKSSGYMASSRQQLRSKSPVADAGVQVPAAKTEKTEEKPVLARPTEEVRNTDVQQRRGSGRFQFRGRGRRGYWGGPRGPFSYRSTEILKFDEDYDFEQANEEFKQLDTKLSNLDLDADSDGVKPAEDESTYDKQKSFFDNISCEASRVAKGIPRFNWRVERKLNVETFGVVRSNPWQRRRRGRGGFRRGTGRGGVTAASSADSPKTVTFAETDVVVENNEVMSAATKGEVIPTVEIVVEN